MREKNYYVSYHNSALPPIFNQLNNALKKCAMRKYRKLNGKKCWLDISWAIYHVVNLACLSIGALAYGLLLVDRSQMG